MSFVTTYVQTFLDKRPLTMGSELVQFLNINNDILKSTFAMSVVKIYILKGALICFFIAQQCCTNSCGPNGLLLTS
jgi:hypothetical protein